MARVIRSGHGKPRWLRGMVIGEGGGRKLGWWNKVVAMVEGSEGNSFGTI